MFEFGSWASHWWKPVLFVVIAGHITNVCVTLFLHRAQTHRGVKFHPLVEIPMREHEDWDEATQQLQGSVELKIPNRWDVNGRLYIRNAMPVAATILAIEPEVKIGGAG